MAKQLTSVQRRKFRVRNAIKKAAGDRLRLSIFRSGKHIYAQIIDDNKGVTVVSASSLDKEAKLKNGGNVEAAKVVGELVAKRAKKAKLSEVVFDRGQYIFHGRVKAVAEGARAGGLSF